MDRRRDLIERLGKSRLYAITSSNGTDASDLLRRSEAVLRGGADILQLRWKGRGDETLLSLARDLRRATDRYGAILIINDRPDIAVAVDADGAHVGQDDLPVEEARRVMGDERILGVSTHALDQAKKAVEDGADYIGVGPVFPTPTKMGRAAVTLDYVRQVAAMAPPIPFFAIGGIDGKNLGQVLAAGAGRVAVVRALFDASDPEGMARGLKNALEPGRIPRLGP